MKNIVNIQKFSKFFPNYILGFPPKREIEIKFSIDLMYRTGPISKAPYRMSTSELPQLKK